MAKHPDAVAWDQWAASEEGRLAIGLPGATGQYLENRLRNAFRAGVAHGRAKPDQVEQLGERLVREFGELLAEVRALTPAAAGRRTPGPAPAPSPPVPPAAPPQAASGSRTAAPAKRSRPGRRPAT